MIVAEKEFIIKSRNDNIVSEMPADTYIHITEIAKETVAGSNPSFLDIKISTKEKEIISQVAFGNEEAFRKLFYMYESLFFCIIQKITNDSLFANDILQDIMLKIWLNRDNLITIDRPREWMIRIVYNTCFNFLRHQKVCSKANKYFKEDKKSHYKGNEVEESVFMNEVKGFIQRAIEELPPQTKKIYRLNRENGMNAGEIAQEMNLSVQTIKNTLTKAVRLLRDYLKQQGVSL